MAELVAYIRTDLSQFQMTEHPGDFRYFRVLLKYIFPTSFISGKGIVTVRNRWFSLFRRQKYRAQTIPYLKGQREFQY